MEVGKHTYGHENIKVENWDSDVLQIGEGRTIKDAPITIGKYCAIAGGCTITLGGNHAVNWVSSFPFRSIMGVPIEIQDHPTSKGPVVIGNDVWIGKYVNIMSGVTIHDGAIIGAYSVVAHDVEPYSIVVGNPAVLKRWRFTFTEIDALLEIKWWDWDEGLIKSSIKYLMNPDVKKFIAYAKSTTKMIDY